MRGPMMVPGFDGIGRSHTPGKCFMCGTSAAARGVVCTGVDITNKVETNRYGKVQFCGECVKAMANLLGMVASDVESRLAAKIDEYSDSRKRLDATRARLDTALKAVEAVVAK